MISEERFYELEIWSASLYDFIDDFVDDFDKVWELKENYFPEESYGNVQENMYSAAINHIYSIYNNVIQKNLQFSKNKLDYFIYGVFKLYCYENDVVIPNYDDFFDFLNYHDGIADCEIKWNVNRKMKKDGHTILFDFKYPCMFLKEEDTIKYIKGLESIVLGITQEVGDTPARQKIMQELDNVINERNNNTVQSSQEEDSTYDLLTEDEFNNVKEIAEAFYIFYNELCNNNHFINEMYSVPELAEAINYYNDPLSVLFAIYGNQICKCYEHLDHYPIDITSKEGAFMCIWIYIYSRKSAPSYTDYILSMFNEEVTTPLKDVIDSFDKSALPGYADTDVISELLAKTDVNIRKKYHILLYKVASVIAEIDGFISDEESRCLTHLLEISETITEETNTEKENVDYIEELQLLIGLDSVKSDVVSLSNFIKMKQMRESKGLKAPQISLHTVFTGNPGTGKTTVARILAGIFKNLGVLKKGHLVETDRSGLVAEYVGQTAVKTNQIIDSALDGVLFIDEAYSLVQGGQNDFGREAISTLLKRMEDDRNRLIVILAGYNDEMQEFINSNPGLRSRFSRYINFPDYSAEELHQIFNINATRNEYTVSSELDKYIHSRLEAVVKNKPKDFGNARFIRNLFERAIENQANRLAFVMDISIDQLSTLDIDDIRDEI